MYSIHPELRYAVVEDRQRDVLRSAQRSYRLPVPVRKRRRQRARGTCGLGHQQPHSSATYICSGASIPSSCNPEASTRAVTSLNARRLARVLASGARRTGQCS